MDGHKIPLHENTCCSHISSAHVTVTLLSRIVSLVFKESCNFMFLFLLGGWEGGGTGLPSSMYTKFFFLNKRNITLLQSVKWHWKQHMVLSQEKKSCGQEASSDTPLHSGSH